MSRRFVCVCMFTLIYALLGLSGCPTLKEVEISCESSLDCPTEYGCNTYNVCAKGVAESVLTIEPGKAFNNAGTATLFTAKFDGRSTTDVTWRVEANGVGTIDSSGKYTSPAQGIFASKTTIRAVSNRHPSLSASAKVIIYPPDNTSAWVMSYFLAGNQSSRSFLQDAHHLAYSEDGYDWSELAPILSEYKPATLGSNRLHDPFILRKLDGTFIVLATDWTRSWLGSDYSPSPNIVVAESSDLITFANERYLKLTPVVFNGEQPMHAWSPEAFYDYDREQYGIIWTGNDANNVNRIYVSYTNDFKTVVNDPIVFFDPGCDVADATLVQTKNRNYLLFHTGGDEPDIQIARSESIEITPGSFKVWSPEYITRGKDQSTSLGMKSPFVVSPEAGIWMMCANHDSDGGNISCWSTSDLDAEPSSWSRIPNSAYVMPPSALHANAVRVTSEELYALANHYGTSSKVKIKSTYVDAEDRPLYLAHSWFHGIITFDGDTDGYLLADDFVLQLLPGVMNTGDISLVTFASTTDNPSFGGWLAVKSDNFDTSLGGANAEYLKTIPEDQRNYLLWLGDPSKIAPAAATFKIEPARNNNPTMVSLKWCGNSSDGTCDDIVDPYYLCYSYFQIFARPLSKSDLCGIVPNNPNNPENPDLSYDSPEDAMSFKLINQ